MKALLRIAVVWNIPFDRAQGLRPVACDRTTADFMISSPLMSVEYEKLLPDCEGYLGRMKRE